MERKDETSPLNNGEKINSVIDYKTPAKFVVILIVLLFLGYGFYTRYYQTNKQPVEKLTQEEVNNEEILICNRTTRLENDTNIDRALSLIYERLTEYGEDDSFFPPQLINCMKVEVKNIKNETGAEGYFDENSEYIKSNYFPIVIDDWGNFFADDLSTALLLVHEITHVQQYIDRYNFGVDPEISDTLVGQYASKMTKSKCLDNEVFAYKNQLKFTLKLKDEEKKSIDYRILADENLHPQLEILKYLKDSLADLSIRNSCETYDTDCINRQIHIKIYNLLRDSGKYNEQCNVYDGSFIGE
jgi:hypothetical protein